MACDGERGGLGADSVVVCVAGVAGADGVRTGSERADGVAGGAGNGRSGSGACAVDGRSAIDREVDAASGSDAGAGEGERSGKRNGEVAGERCSIADRERGRLLVDRETDRADGALVVFVGGDVGSGDGVRATG